MSFSSAPGAPLAMPPGLSPDTTDTLTELTTLLARIRVPTSGNNTAPNSTSGKKPTNNNNNNAGGTSSTTATPASAAAVAAAAAAAGGGELTLNTLAPAADALRHRFQKARALIRTLPDMDRGCDEQEAEIRELEARLRRQHECLARLRDTGARFAAAVGPEPGGEERMVE